jgi:hypothetical protein
LLQVPKCTHSARVRYRRGDALLASSRRFSFDAAGVSPIPVQMWERGARASGACTPTACSPTQSERRCAAGTGTAGPCSR